MKTNNIFNTGNVKVDDGEALSILGIEDVAYFRQALKGSSHVGTLAQTLGRRKELQKQNKVPLTREQWKLFWEEQGKNPQTTMRPWHFEEDGTVRILLPFFTCLQKPFPYGIRSVVGQMDIVGGDATELGEMPGSVKGHLVISACKNLTSLRGLEDTNVGGDIIINNCSKLLSVEGLPRHIESSIVFRRCIGLKTLKHLPDSMGGLDLRGCPDLDDLPVHSEIKGDIVVLQEQIKLRKVLESQGRSYHILGHDE